MADFCALCTELVAIEDAMTSGTSLTSNQGQALDGFSALANFRDIASRARAALAQPEPQGPTDEELCETYRTAYYAEPNRQGPHCQAAGLRAVLARWGKA